MLEEEGEIKDIIKHDKLKIIKIYLIDYYLYILVYAVFITIVFGFYFLLAPKYRYIINYNELYRNNKIKEITQLKNALTTYQDYQKIYEAISEGDKNKINSFLPDYNDGEELLIYIRNMMTQGGFRLSSLEIDDIVQGEIEINSSQIMTNEIDENGDSVNVNGEVAPGIVGSINISLGVEGLNYNSIKKLLFYIARDARFFDVQNIEFSLATGKAELELKTYYLK